MTVVDTNVLVRIITNDDHSQAIRAAAFLRGQDKVVVAKTVLLELVWVPRSAYRIDRREIISALREVLSTKNVEIEDEGSVRLAIDWHEHGLDFADALHMASAGPEYTFATFDGALRRAAGRIGVVKLASI
ncbi:MAG: type II toxin-antitoxin system VapC family toxin [Deltaproteobacteria bacterium]|nr:type II toxin-antitoxin system VapC family toxin [Deltaproteobacteria bacterium]